MTSCGHTIRLFQGRRLASGLQRLKCTFLIIWNSKLRGTLWDGTLRKSISTMSLRERLDSFHSSYHTFPEPDLFANSLSQPRHTHKDAPLSSSTANMKSAALFTTAIAASLASLASGVPVASDDHHPKWTDIKDHTADYPFVFTSTYKVVATPEQVINATGPTPGEPGAIGYFNYGINSELEVICYVSDSGSLPCQMVALSQSFPVSPPLVSCSALGVPQVTRVTRR